MLKGVAALEELEGAAVAVFAGSARRRSGGGAGDRSGRAGVAGESDFRVRQCSFGQRVRQTSCARGEEGDRQRGREGERERRSFKPYFDIS